MLNAIFEEANLKNKLSTAVSTGEWGDWTASELDDLVTGMSGEEADDFVRKVVQSDRDFPDNLYEALTRKYSNEEISGSIESAMIDHVNGKLYIHQSLFDRLENQSKQRIIREVGSIASGMNPEREVRTTVDGKYKFTRVPWDATAVERAQNLIKQVRREKAQAAAAKGLITKKTGKEVGLRPTMTEHWQKWMPDEVPTADTSWEKLRPKLKTQSKADIDTMLREMEKVGVISPNEHGSKVFRADKYQEIMKAPKDKFATSHVKDFRGTYHNAQMIRGKGADSALVSVGLPASVEKKWKTEHPKLYAFMKDLRKSNHKSVHRGSRPFGWVRIDKLNAENWLIEELQQDVDNLEHPQVGNMKYNALTHQHAHDDSTKAAHRTMANVGDSQKALPLVEKWYEIVKANDAGWRALEVERQKLLGDILHITWDSFKPTNDPTLPKNLLDVIPDMLAARKALNEVGVHARTNEWFKPNDVLAMINDLKEKLAEAQKQADHHLKDAAEARARIDRRDPESSETQEWQKDIAAMREVVDKFPRWAMHAVKLTAKAHGVKNLWWVTYAQKVKLGGANPPRSFTSDQLAKKFGFKKVPLNLNAPYNDPSYPLSGTGIMQPIVNGYTTKTMDGVLSDNDKYLWFCPVDQVITEQARKLDIGIFG
jgi:hypothetical protein